MLSPLTEARTGLNFKLLGAKQNPLQQVGLLGTRTPWHPLVTSLLALNIMVAPRHSLVVWCLNSEAISMTRQVVVTLSQKLAEGLGTGLVRLNRPALLAR